MNVYVIKSAENKKKPIVKIGKADNVEARLKTLQTGNSQLLEVVDVIPCTSRAHAFAVESEIHDIFSDLRINGEWFLYSANLRNYIKAKSTGDLVRMDRAITKHEHQSERDHFKWKRINKSTAAPEKKGVVSH